jgi:hypothetical protein
MMIDIQGAVDAITKKIADIPTPKAAGVIPIMTGIEDMKMGEVNMEETRMVEVVDGMETPKGIPKRHVEVGMTLIWRVGLIEIRTRTIAVHPVTMNNLGGHTTIVVVRVQEGGMVIPKHSRVAKETNRMETKEIHAIMTMIIAVPRVHANGQKIRTTATPITMVVARAVGLVIGKDIQKQLGKVGQTGIKICHHWIAN